MAFIFHASLPSVGDFYPNQRLYDFPAIVVVPYTATGDESIKEKALSNAIPELL